MNSQFWHLPPHQTIGQNATKSSDNLLTNGIYSHDIPLQLNSRKDRGDGQITDTPLLQVENLHTHFLTKRGLVRAVDGVSFNLKQGMTLGLVGESGCGKTILCRTLMALLPPSAKISDNARILFNGHDLRHLDEKSLRAIRGREVAMIFQDPMTSLNPVMKVGAQISETLIHHLGTSKQEARERGIKLLRAVGISAPERRIDEYPHQLSGGIRQRVAIAIALACEPKLLIADEPTTALDVTVQSGILDLLQEQQRERDMSMILITHDLGVVAGRTDEIAVMYAGMAQQVKHVSNDVGRCVGVD